MFWLGLILPICYVVPYTGAAIPTQWPVLSIALTWGLWRKGNVEAILPLLAVLAWGCISLTWAPSAVISVYGLWIACIWALSLWLGTTIESLDALWKGLAIGLSISSTVAIGQHYGLSLVEGSSDFPPGLLYNSTVHAFCIAVVILGLMIGRHWLYIPAMLPGLYLAHSRGGYAVFAIGVLGRFVKLRILLSCLVGGSVYFYLHLGPSDVDRIHIWAVAMSGMSWVGNGIGSFIMVFYQDGGHVVHPGRVHNDYLELWFELGIGACLVFMVLAKAAVTESKYQSILVAILVGGLFYFPLYLPITAFLAFLLAGHALRDFRWSWPRGGNWRYFADSRKTARKSGNDGMGDADIPV